MRRSKSSAENCTRSFFAFGAFDVIAITEEMLSGSPGHRLRSRRQGAKYSDHAADDRRAGQDRLRLEAQI